MSQGPDREAVRRAIDQMEYQGALTSTPGIRGWRDDDGNRVVMLGYEALVDAVVAVDQRGYERGLRERYVVRTFLAEYDAALTAAAQTQDDIDTETIARVAMERDEARAAHERTKWSLIRERRRAEQAEAQVQRVREVTARMEAWRHDPHGTATAIDALIRDLTAALDGER